MINPEISRAFTHDFIVFNVSFGLILTFCKIIIAPSHPLAHFSIKTLCTLQLNNPMKTNEIIKYTSSKKVNLICTHRAIQRKTTQKVKIRNKEQKMDKDLTKNFLIKYFLSADRQAYSIFYISLYENQGTAL